MGTCVVDGKIFTVLILILNSGFYFALAEEDVCFLYVQKNFSKSPILSLQPSVKVFETRLIFNLPADKGIQIQSVKLSKPHCTVILCNEKQLQGQCEQFSSSLSDVSVQDKKVHQNVKSIDCHCPDSESEVASANKSDDSSVEVTKSERIQQETPCSTIYRDWHYKGQSHEALFPGASGKIDLGSKQQIRSVSVKTGCTLMLWGFKGDTSDEVVTFSISNSTSFLEMVLIIQSLLCIIMKYF